MRVGTLVTALALLPALSTATAQQPQAAPSPPAQAQPTSPPQAAPQAPRVPPLTLWERSGRDSTPITGGAAIVDINSSIGIAINSELVRARVAGETGDSATGELLARAQVLANFITVASDSLRALVAAARRVQSGSATATDTALARDATTAMFRLIGPVLDVAPPGTRLHDALNAGLEATVNPDSSPSTPFRAIFDTSAAEAQRLRDDLDASLQRGGVYVQLGAFLRSGGSERPIHIPGFDRFVAGERIVVPTFDIAISEQDRAEYQQVEEQAKRYNEGGFKALTSDLRSWANAELRRLESLLRPCSDTFVGSMQATLSAASQQQAVVMNARQQVLNLVALARELAGRYGAGVPLSVATLTQMADDLQELKNAANAVSVAVQAVADHARDLVGPSGTLPTALAGAVTRCKGALDSTKAAVAGIVPYLAPATSLGEGGQDLQAFAAEVTRHTVHDLPERAEIDLPSAGRRSPGDVVLVRLVYGQGDGPPKELDSRRLLVYRTRMYFSTSASLVFAHPVRPLALENYFQAGASYSVLLKPLIRGAARSSTTYNEFGDFGLGINVAALDFDHDDTPEIALGFVFSAIKDVLQVGWGYNIGTDTGYGFFGVRLPLLGSQLPTVGMTGPGEEHK